VALKKQKASIVQQPKDLEVPSLFLDLPRMMSDYGRVLCTQCSIESVRKNPMSLFALSAIGTSTDPHRASLAIAGSDQMRFAPST